MASDEELRGLANAAGYAFQLGVENSLRKLVRDNRCQITATEHPWHHPESGETGFIDLVVEVAAGRLVVECKRTRDARWLFLAPRAQEHAVSRYRGLWYQLLEPGTVVSEWSDIDLSPKSPEAAFCCVRGSGEPDLSFLDRIGSQMIKATEGLLDEELRIGKSDFCLYMPVLVTNSELYIGRFDPSEMDLSTGLVDRMDFTKVDVVRYRKALLASRSNDTRGVASIEESNLASQRSVLVVAADKFGSLIEEIRLKPHSWTVGYPWQIAYTRYKERRS